MTFSEFISDEKALEQSAKCQEKLIQYIWKIDQKTTNFRNLYKSAWQGLNSKRPRTSVLVLHLLHKKATNFAKYRDGYFLLDTNLI